MRAALLATVLLAALPAAARDNGQYGTVDPATKQWFSSLTNQRGDLCCDTADGHRVEDPDWRIEPDGSYSVSLNGAWKPIPPEMVVKGNNRVGFAIVWLYPPFAPQLRCFMPGTTA